MTLLTIIAFLVDLICQPYKYLEEEEEEDVQRAE